MLLKGTPDVIFEVQNSLVNKKVKQELNILFDKYCVESEEVMRFVDFIKRVASTIQDLYLDERKVPLSVYNIYVRFTSDDYQELYKAYSEKNYDMYRSVLQARWKKAMLHYINNIFFINYEVSGIDGYLNEYKNQYPWLSNGIFAKTKTKWFFKKCISAMISELERDIPQAIEEKYDIYKKQNPKVDEHMLILRAIGDVVFISWCSDDFLIEFFSENWHRQTITLLQETQQKMLQKSKNTGMHKEKTKQPIEKIHIKSEKTKEGDSKKQIFEQVFNGFTHAIKDKVDSALEDIKNYVFRMYKSNKEVHIQYIIDRIGEPYDPEIIVFVQNLCLKLNIKVKEIKSITKELTDILSQEALPQVVQTQIEMTDAKNQNDVLLSKTLLEIKNTPHKLTTEVLMQICKELWYKYDNEDVFRKDCKKFWLEKIAKTSLPIRKKIIDLLLKPEDTGWSHKSSGKRCLNYETLELTWWNRIVKQWKTIVRWLLDHKTYEDRINKYFVKEKCNFDI